MQRLRHQLLEYFPAALDAFDDLDALDTLELLGKAPDPARAAKLTRAQISAALKRARRRNIPDKATAALAALRREQLGQPPAVTAAYTVTVRSLIALITVLNEQVKTLQGQVEENSAGTRTLRSTGPSPAWARSLAPGYRRVRRRPAPLRRRQEPQELRGHQPDHPRLGKEEGRRRPLHPQRPAGQRPELPGLRVPERLTWRPSPLRDLRARDIEHNDALRRLANRLVGILHGCLKTRTLYDEATAWSHREKISQSDVAA